MQRACFCSGSGGGGGWEEWKRDWFCSVERGGGNGRGLVFAQGELLLEEILPLKDCGA